MNERATDGASTAASRSTGACLALALLCVPGLAAAEDSPRVQVWFRGGRSVIASALEPADDQGALTRVTLVDGATFTVATSHVKRLLSLPPEVSVEAAAEPADASAELVPVADEGRGVARWMPLVEAAAARHGLDPALVRAIMTVESGGEPGAVSPKGAVGLMQLMPATARDYGCVDLRDPAKNIEAGCKHLARLEERMDGQLDLVLAAYNAGEGAVARWGGVPRYRETVKYVRLVRAHLERLWAASEDLSS